MQKILRNVFKNNCRRNVVYKKRKQNVDMKTVTFFPDNGS